MKSDPLITFRRESQRLSTPIAWSPLLKSSVIALRADTNSIAALPTTLNSSL